MIFGVLYQYKITIINIDQEFTKITRLKIYIIKNDGVVYGPLTQVHFDSTTSSTKSKKKEKLCDSRPYYPSQTLPLVTA